MQGIPAVQRVLEVLDYDQKGRRNCPSYFYQKPQSSNRIQKIFLSITTKTIKFLKISI